MDILLILALIFATLVQATLVQSSLFNPGKEFDTTKCSLSPALVAEIGRYKVVANNIFTEATTASLKHKTYDDLKFFVDTFGPRLSGSAALEKALSYVQQKLLSFGLVNVHSENVLVPKLTRKLEIGRIVLPYEQEVGIIGTGSTVSTPITGLQKQIFFVNSTHPLSDEARNKIVVFDDIATSLPSWRMAQQYGAAAILQRSQVLYSLGTIFTRAGENLGQNRQIFIPLAFIQNEVVDLFGRLDSSGTSIQFYMNIQQELGPAVSRNVVGELKGISKPDEVVIISGHTDSWDLSQGALDDGVGVILAYQVQVLLQNLKLIPRRTLRTVFWTAEEVGLVGSFAYAKRHKVEMQKLSTVLEADHSCLAASGYIFGGPAKYGCILNKILKLMKDTLGPMNLRTTNTAFHENVLVVPEISTDVGSFFASGVPGATLNGDTKNFALFRTRHTAADTMSVVKSEVLDKCLALFATTAYVIADMSEMMPRIMSADGDI